MVKERGKDEGAKWMREERNKVSRGRGEGRGGGRRRGEERA